MAILHTKQIQWSSEISYVIRFEWFRMDKRFLLGLRGMVEFQINWKSKLHVATLETAS